MQYEIINYEFMNDNAFLSPDIKLKDTQSQMEMHLQGSQLETPHASGEQMCRSSHPFPATLKPVSSFAAAVHQLAPLVTQCPSSPLPQARLCGLQKWIQPTQPQCRGGGGLEVSRGANESEEPIGCF